MAVRVPDLDAAVHWYVATLSFRLKRRWRQGDLELAFLSPAGDDHFTVELLSMPRMGSTPGSPDGGWGWDHLCLSVDNIDAALHALSELGVPVTRGPFVVQEIGQKIAFIADPWGNTLELTGPVAP